MSTTSSDTTEQLVAQAQHLDLEDRKGSESWERAKSGGTEATFVDADRSLGRLAVELPDGEGPHETLLVKAPNGDMAGACDCDGYEYHDKGCAHLIVRFLLDSLGMRDIPESGEYLDSITPDPDEIPAAPSEAEMVEEAPTPDTVDETAHAPAQTRDDAFATALPDVDDQYVMELNGDTYIKKAGYARLLKSAGYTAVPSVVQWPWEGDRERCVAKAVIKDEDGELVAQNFGSAGPPEAEDLSGAENELIELATTRAWTRAAAIATGEGLTAVAEVDGSDL
jgi:hypothetical protein